MQSLGIQEKFQFIFLFALFSMFVALSKMAFVPIYWLKAILIMLCAYMIYLIIDHYKHKYKLVYD
jgi:hypothetical protein